jgi:hypothetical protein
MALQTYTEFYAFIDGKLLAEAVTVTVDHKNNAQPVHTIAKGFSGMSPGANETSVKVSNVHPRAGAEFNAVESLQNLTLHDFVFFRGSKKVKCKGYVTDVSEGGGVNKEATYDFTAMCGPVEESSL